MSCLRTLLLVVVLTEECQQTAEMKTEIFKSEGPAQLSLNFTG